MNYFVLFDTTLQLSCKTKEMHSDYEQLGKLVLDSWLPFPSEFPSQICLHSLYARHSTSEKVVFHLWMKWWYYMIIPAEYAFINKKKTLHLSAVKPVKWGNPLRLQGSSTAMLWYGNIMFLLCPDRQGRCSIDSRRLAVVTPFSRRLIRMEYLLLSGNISCKDFKYTCNFYASWAFTCSYFSTEKHPL